MASNSFLKDFMEMRKGLKPNSIPKDSHIPTPVQKKKRGEPKTTQELDTINTTLQKIVEDKPPKKQVVNYLQEKANYYTVEKMK